jgi:hypothetical protein
VWVRRATRQSPSTTSSSRCCAGPRCWRRASRGASRRTTCHPARPRDRVDFHHLTVPFRRTPGRRWFPPPRRAVPPDPGPAVPAERALRARITSLRSPHPPRGLRTVRPPVRQQTFRPTWTADGSERGVGALSRPSARVSNRPPASPVPAVPTHLVDCGSFAWTADGEATRSTADVSPHVDSRRFAPRGLRRFAPRGLRTGVSAGLALTPDRRPGFRTARPHHQSPWSPPTANYADASPPLRLRRHSPSWQASRPLPRLIGTTAGAAPV